MMFCEQAIFTSARTSRQEGYQLAVTSDGLRGDLVKELAQWGPAHDSLLDPAPGSRSVNFHPLSSGDYCISRTVAEGEEYSGRAGPRIYTHMLVLSPGLFARFANQPFAVLEAAIAAGAMPVHDQPPAKLEPLRLVGRASLTNRLRLAELAVEPGVDGLLRFVSAALAAPRVAVYRRASLERLMQGLFLVLPPPFRPEFSFTTGLRHSARRPFRLLPAPPAPVEQRALERASGATILDLSSKAEPAAESSAWADLIRDLLQTGNLSLLPDMLARATHFHDSAQQSGPPPTLDEIAQNVLASTM